MKVDELMVLAEELADASTFSGRVVARKNLRAALDACVSGISIDLIAIKWVTAEAERKVRKREASRAIMMAHKSGAEFDTDNPEGPWFADGPEQDLAVNLAICARKKYHDVARSAGALRAALIKACGNPTPEPDSDVAAAFNAYLIANPSAYPQDESTT